MPPFPGGVRESRIRYPLQVDAWQAVGEHLFEDPEDGMSVRYAHGANRDRWIDVYFYPADASSTSGFSAAAQHEADLIRQAHALAGYGDCDHGPLREFGFRPDDAPGSECIEGFALDLAYTVDGTVYSSAMTLLLQDLHFIKARFSIERTTLSRDEASEQLLAFTAHLQPRLSITHCDGSARPRQAADARAPATAGLREIRLEYQAAVRSLSVQPVSEEAGAG